MIPLLIPLIAALAGGAAGVGISHVERATDRAYNSAEAQKQRDFNALEAEKNYERQQSLTQDQYRLQTQGMIEAGLNPVNMYSSGNVGSVPTTSSASSGASPTATSGLTSVAHLVSSACNLASKHIDNHAKMEALRLRQDHSSVGLLGMLKKFK